MVSIGGLTDHVVKAGSTAPVTWFSVNISLYHLYHVGFFFVETYQFLWLCMDRHIPIQTNFAVLKWASVSEDNGIRADDAGLGYF